MSETQELDVFDSCRREKSHKPNIATGVCNDDNFEIAVHFIASSVNIKGMRFMYLPMYEITLSDNFKTVLTSQGIKGYFVNVKDDGELTIGLISDFSRIRGLLRNVGTGDMQRQAYAGGFTMFHKSGILTTLYTFPVSDSAAFYKMENMIYSTIVDRFERADLFYIVARINGTRDQYSSISFGMGEEIGNGAFPFVHILNLRIFASEYLYKILRYYFLPYGARLFYDPRGWILEDPKDAGDRRYWADDNFGMDVRSMHLYNGINFPVDFFNRNMFRLRDIGYDKDMLYSAELNKPFIISMPHEGMGDMRAETCITFTNFDTMKRVLYTTLTNCIIEQRWGLGYLLSLFHILEFEVFSYLYLPAVFDYKTIDMIKEALPGISTFVTNRDTDGGVGVILTTNTRVVAVPEGSLMVYSRDGEVTGETDNYLWVLLFNNYEMAGRTWDIYYFMRCDEICEDDEALIRVISPCAEDHISEIKRRQAERKQRLTQYVSSLR